MKIFKFGFAIIFVVFIFYSFPRPVSAVFNPFRAINDRIQAAKTISTKKKSTPEKIIDKVITFPGNVVNGAGKAISNIMPGGNKIKSDEVQSAEDYQNFRKNVKNGAKSLIKFTKTRKSNVKGVSTQKGQVLGDSTSSYVQYLPIPGQGNFSSSGFTGSSQINIPLNLSKGFGGYTPAVSLNYSSSAVDSFKTGEDVTKMFLFTTQSGPLGLGWSIGESSISIDNHQSANPCSWTWKIGFPGGQGEMFKVDAQGNKITKCEWKKTIPGDPDSWDWVTTSAWNSSSEWRTTPEMFLKIKSGRASGLFPGDTDFANDADVWKIQTPDGATYAFGAGKDRSTRDGTMMFHHEPWVLPPNNLHCNTVITGWKLYESKNIFGEKIKYTYQPANTGSAGKCKQLVPVSSSRLTQIQYGVNRVQFNYNQLRNDVKVVRESDTYPEDFEYYTKKDQYRVDNRALSDIVVFANNNQVRKYKLSYYDSWQTAPDFARFNADCGNGRFGYNTGGGLYILNDNVKSYHLMLKSVEEEISPGHSLPKQIFTYQNIPYTVNNIPCHPNKLVDDQNSIDLKTASNGFGGVTEYFYDAQRLSDRVYESNGKTYLSNEINVKDNDKGSKRARLSKIRVSDGISNFSESVMEYGTNEPLDVYTPDFDSDFLGYPSVTTYSGKKNLSLTNTADAKQWLSKSKTNFYQMLTSAGCVRKDPRSGMSYRQQQFDDAGVIAESTSVISFKNPNGNESCTQIPDRPLVLSLESQSIKANRGVNLGANTMSAMCASSNPPSYCNFMSVSKNTYDWDLNLTNNPEKGKFGALTKSESYLKKILADKVSFTTKLMSSSQTNYVSQGYVGTSIYLLNKPYESWIKNVDNLADSQKYKWQRIYYDNLGLGVLSANGKNLVSKSESLLANGQVAGRSEVVGYDTWGNVIQTRDGNGNTSSVVYDNLFHVYPIGATNAKNQTVGTRYDFQFENSSSMGLPIMVTDINGQVTRSEYDALGRLTKMFKHGDSQPSLEFTYSFVNENPNQMTQFNAPIAVLAKVRTVRDTTDDSKILKTYDLYDGLGNKIQSQSSVAGRVMTSWQDQDPGATSMIGMKTFSTESFVSDKAFGFFNKSYPDTTKISYSETNLSGNYSKSTDIVGNNAYSFTNSEQAVSKTISPNMISSISISDPINRISTSMLCKDKNTTVDNVFDCPTPAKIVGRAFSDFMGIAVKTTDNKGAVISKSTHDSLGRTTSSYDHDLGASSIESYDLNNNVLKTKDAANTIFEVSYDSLNRPINKKVNEAVKTQFYYDQAFQGVDCGTSPKGRLCYENGKGNNPLNSSSTIIDKFYKYDALGRLIQTKTKYAGGLDLWFGSSFFTTDFSYDNIDRMTSVKYPEFSGSGIPSETVNYTYDGPYLKTVTGDKTYVTDLAYDERGRLVTRKLGNGLDESYAYDDAATRALIGIAVYKSGVANPPKIVDLNYAYDNQTGNISQITNSGITKTYEYDNLSRLTKSFQGRNQANLETFAYDDLNSMTQKNENGKNISFVTNYNPDENVRPYHGVNQIIANGVGNVEYDVLGRMTSYDIPRTYKITVSSFDLASGKPEKITHGNSSIVPLPTSGPPPPPPPKRPIVPSISASPSATIAPVATVSAGIVVPLKPGINQNLNVSFFETAKDVISAVETQCGAQTGTYLTLLNSGVRKTYVMDYTTQNFDIQAAQNFDINLVATQNCNLNLIPIKVDMSAVKGATSPITEVYFYDGEGNRIMKSVLDSTGAITKPVLYVSSYLERDFGANLIRKNYFADGKLVATRVFDLNPAVIPTTIPSVLPTVVPCPTGQENPHFEVNRFGACTSVAICGINASQCNNAQ